jgi:hypothetical protein
LEPKKETINWINGLAIFGLLVSAIGSILNSILGGDARWTSAVLSAALLAIAIAFISFLKAIQEFHAMVEAQIKAQTPDRDSLALLRHLLRSVIFRDQSGFDPVFWTAFGQCVLSQDNLDQYKRMELVALACESKKAMVNKDDAYAMMGLLFHRIQFQRMRYLATATEAETRDPAAQFLLFEFPKQQPDCVQRMFNVSNRQAFIDGLTEAQRNDLIKQLDGGTLLRVLLKASLDNPDNSVPNFGIYGNIAVGKLFANGNNEFDFNLARVETETRRYNGFWERATPLLVQVDPDTQARKLA